MKKTIAFALALGLPALTCLAQPGPGGPPQGRPPGPPPQGCPMGGPNAGQGFQQRWRAGNQGQQMPIPPLVGALDANHDGVIDKTEIENASTALKKLDKNKDGELTRDEIAPAFNRGNRPGGGGGFGPNRQGGGGGRGGQQRPPAPDGGAGAGPEQQQQPAPEPGNQ